MLQHGTGTGQEIYQQTELVFHPQVQICIGGGTTGPLSYILYLEEVEAMKGENIMCEDILKDLKYQIIIFPFISAAFTLETLDYFQSLIAGNGAVHSLHINGY